MRVIYKYRIEEGGSTVIRAHVEEFLDAQEQYGKLTIWAIVDPEKEPSDIFVTAYGTGWPMPEVSIGDYFRTVQMPDGLVWHIFIKEPPDD